MDLLDDYSDASICTHRIISEYVQSAGRYMWTEKMACCLTWEVKRFLKTRAIQYCQEKGHAAKIVYDDFIRPARSAAGGNHTACRRYPENSADCARLISVMNALLISVGVFNLLILGLCLILVLVLAVSCVRAWWSDPVPLADSRTTTIGSQSIKLLLGGGHRPTRQHSDKCLIIKPIQSKERILQSSDRHSTDSKTTGSNKMLAEVSIGRCNLDICKR